MSLANVKLGNLRAVREEKGLSIMALSYASTVAHSTIHNAERGLPVKATTAAKLARALQVKVGVLNAE